VSVGGVAFVVFGALACGKGTSVPTPPAASAPTEPVAPPAASAAAVSSAPAPAASSAAAATSAQKPECDAIFAAPPGGDLLCDEHIMPTSGPKDEIHWRSYGLTDDRTTACDRYRTAANKCTFGVTFKPPLCNITDNATRRAELYPKDSTAYPHCSTAPAAKHKTVLIVSEKASP
jgi:hypothetical protein